MLRDSAKVVLITLTGGRKSCVNCSKVKASSEGDGGGHVGDHEGGL